MIDDDAMIRSFLKPHFEGHEFGVGLAEVGKDALSKAAANVPDLIVLYMNMPVMTSWDAAKELKKDGAPIIALTTKKTHDEQVAAHEADCDTFVEKPIDPARLLEAVKRVLG